MTKALLCNLTLISLFNLLQTYIFFYFLGSCQHPSLPALCISFPAILSWLLHCVFGRAATSPAPQYNALFKPGHMNALSIFPTTLRKLWTCKQIPKHILVLGFLVRTFVLRFKGSFKNLFSYNCHHICILIIPMCHRVASYKWGMSSLLLRAICCYTNGELSGAVV